MNRGEIKMELKIPEIGFTLIDVRSWHFCLMAMLMTNTAWQDQITLCFFGPKISFRHGAGNIQLEPLVPGQVLLSSLVSSSS